MRRVARPVAIATAALLAWMARGEAGPAVFDTTAHDLASLQAAVKDLVATFGPRYPRGPEFLERTRALAARAKTTSPAALRPELDALRREALLADPRLDGLRVLVVKRKPRPLQGSKAVWSMDKGSTPFAGNGLDIGLPSNHEGNPSVPRQGWDNEIAILDLRADSPPVTVYRPPDGGYAGEIDLHWDGDRILFTKADAVNWKIMELALGGGSSPRPVSRLPDDIDAMDACYLPNGRIIFGCTASYQSVPCWHGIRPVVNLYLMNADGGGVRQVCFDQDHNFHSVILPDGQVLYHRWDYTGPSHIFLRPLMAMNPDGTAQRAVYGSNSWFPNALYFPRPLPGRAGQLVCILSGYHGVHRMGQLVVVDTSRGWHEADGIVKRISGRGDPVRPAIRDNLVDEDWPKFLHPYPISDKQFLVACLPRPGASWGLYLADVFDNLVPLRELPGYALLEPIPLRREKAPPVIADRVDLARDDATVYLHDVYAGPGLAGVPRGTIKSLRVMAYHFGYRGLAGPDCIGIGGPWEAMRILGATPLEPDGSAFFRVPARTPLAVQALDAQGRAVQLMRSWFTAQPGEAVSCVGCHESPRDTPRPALAAAARRAPADLAPWRGPARGFDFAREVQPVLDRKCAGCHDGTPGRPDLRREELVPGYQGKRLTDLAVQRMHPTMLAATKGVVRFTPAYEALLPYVRRVGFEDDVSLLLAGEYYAGTSPLVPMLAKGHSGVALDAEEWDRLYTWIDLNAPCHGTWGEVFPVPDGAHARRMELRRDYGGPTDDPETIPAPASSAAATVARPTSAPAPAATVSVPGWPFDGAEARRRQAAAGPAELVLDLGGGVTMRLVRVPAGAFVMGDSAGEPDETPARAEIARAFWLGATEVDNAQFRRFRPDHDPCYYGKRHARPDDQGLMLNEPRQPAVRVSWEDAEAFCRWLGARTGLRLRLPTEAEWEWACRAGSADPLSFGPLSADFAPWANLADQLFGVGLQKGGIQGTGGLVHLALEGAALVDSRHNDGAVVTAAVGGRRPNAWGLHDMHGNAAEWTATDYAPRGADAEKNPVRVAQPRGYEEPAGMGAAMLAGKVVRGGSFFDPPARARSAFRLAYPPWQRVFNVGFRVAGEDAD